MAWRHMSLERQEHATFTSPLLQVACNRLQKTPRLLHFHGLTPPPPYITNNMDTTRLRKTFAYPSDSPNASDSELDEEHQEKLIAELQTRDSEKSTLYRHAFLSIPVLGALFFLYGLITATSANETSIAVVSLSSLGCTAYILHYMPIEAPERKGKRAVYAVEAEKGPVERWLVLLNAVLAGLLLIAAGLSWRRDKGEEAWRRALPMSKINSNTGEQAQGFADTSGSHIRPYNVRSTTTSASRSRGSSQGTIRAQRRMRTAILLLIINEVQKTTDRPLPSPSQRGIICFPKSSLCLNAVPCLNLSSLIDGVLEAQNRVAE